MIELNRLTGARDATVLDANLQAIATASAALTGDNFAHEGLDRLVCADAVAHQVPDSSSHWRTKESNTRTPLTNTASALLTVGITAMQINNGGAGFTIPTGYQARVRFGCFLDTISTGPAFGCPNQRYVDFEIYYQVAGSGVNTLLKGCKSSQGNHNPGGPGNEGSHHCVFLEGYLDAGSYDEVRVMSQLQGGAGTYYVNHALFTLVELNKVS